MANLDITVRFVEKIKIKVKLGQCLKGSAACLQVLPS